MIDFGENTDAYEYFNENALSSKERNELKDSDFGIPELRKYPLTDEEHVRKANSFFKFAPKKYKAELAKRILTEANAIKCPKCGKELAPIIYGLPTSEAVEASSRGEIFLGGCEVYPNSPKYHCYNCILDFDKDLKKPTKSDNTPIDFLDFGEE